MFGGALVRRAVILIAAALLLGVAVNAQNTVDAIVEKFAREPEHVAPKKEPARKADDVGARKKAEHKAAQENRLQRIRKQAEAARAAAVARIEADKLRAQEEEEMLARARQEAEEAKATSQIRSLIEQAEAERLKVEALIAEASGKAEPKATAPAADDQPPAQSETGPGNVAILEQRAVVHRDVFAKLATVRKAREARVARHLVQVAQQAEVERARLEEEARAGHLRLVERRRLETALARARTWRVVRLAAQAERTKLVEAARAGQLRLTERRRLVTGFARVRLLREARLARVLQMARENVRLAEEARLGLQRVKDGRRLRRGLARARQVREARLAARAVDRPIAAAKESAPRMASIQGPAMLGAPALPPLAPVAPPAPPSPSAGRAEFGGDPRGRVAVLLVMAPGNYGIRRGATIADPILCVLDGCYVSAGPQAAAKFMPGRRALGIGNTLGGRAGACRQSLGCVFRGVELQLPGLIQPVDLHILKHDRRRPEIVVADSDCRVAAGRLACSRPHVSQSYALWIVPEEVANSAGPEALERAIQEGLAPARSADAAPSR